VLAIRHDQIGDEAQVGKRAARHLCGSHVAGSPGRPSFVAVVIDKVDVQQLVGDLVAALAADLEQLAAVHVLERLGIHRHLTSSGRVVSTSVLKRFRSESSRRWS
jgi:hypothetical protein